MTGIDDIIPNSDELEPDATTLDKLNKANSDILSSMLEMPEEHNKEMIKARRKHVFKFLWETLSFEKQEALELVIEREEDGIKALRKVESDLA